MASGMGTSCTFDLIVWVLSKPLESGALIVVQSDSLAALLTAMKLSSPKM